MMEVIYVWGGSQVNVQRTFSVTHQFCILSHPCLSQKKFYHKFYVEKFYVVGVFTNLKF